MSHDIGPELKSISELIEGCSYNSATNNAAFFKWGKTIIIKNNEISILNIKDETEAHSITKIIKNLVENNRKVGETIIPKPLNDNMED